MRQKNGFSRFIIDLVTYRNRWTVLEIIFYFFYNCSGFVIMRVRLYKSHFEREDQLKREWQQHTYIHIKSDHRV